MAIALEPATNCWTKAIESLMVALANSARFREIVGDAADATAANAFIFGDELADPNDGHAYTSDELRELRYYAQVYSFPEGAAGLIDNGAGFEKWSGTAIIHIERLVPEYEKNAQASLLGLGRWFENRVGDLMSQVRAYSVSNSGPRIKSIDVSKGPFTNSDGLWEAHGMWHGIELSVEWGY